MAETKYCRLCGRYVEVRRKIGAGSVILFFFTLGFWILAIPFYRKYCPICKGSSLSRFKSDSTGSLPVENKLVSSQSVDSRTTSKCPFCAEQIQDEAIKCRYCGEILDTDRAKWAGYVSEYRKVSVEVQHEKWAQLTEDQKKYLFENFGLESPKVEFKENLDANREWWASYVSEYRTASAEAQHQKWAQLTEDQKKYLSENFGIESPKFDFAEKGNTPSRGQSTNWAALLFVLIGLLFVGIWLQQRMEEQAETEQPLSASAREEAEAKVESEEPMEASQTKSESTTRTRKPTDTKPDPLSTDSYSLLMDDSYEDFGTAKIIWKVFAKEVTSKEDLEDLLNELYFQAERKEFQRHDKPTVIDIKAYLSNRVSGVWVGWARNGVQGKPIFLFNERQLNQFGKKEEVRRGLSEGQRKQVFREIVQAEDRARNEAERRYPNPYPDAETFQKREALVDTLIDRNRAELAKKFGLTRAQLDEIANEGLRKSWPLPSG